MPYVTDGTYDELVDVMSLYIPNFSDDDVVETHLLIATMKVNGLLSNYGLDPDDITDGGTILYQFLVVAEICFYMEEAQMFGSISSSFSSLTQETIGEYTRKYDNASPMFFFATGGSERFMGLLQHETWRMQGYEFVKRYIALYELRNPDQSRHGYHVNINDDIGWSSTDQTSLGW